MGSDSKYLRLLVEEHGATYYEMNENYRSKANIVEFANRFAGRIQERMKKHPITAVKDEPGTVQLIHYKSNNIEQPLVNQIMQTYHGGKACVLTNTNEEAFRVLGLLSKEGIRAKLIQSNEGFRLYNLAEVRWFLKIIDSELQSPVIPDFLWESAKKQLETKYRKSNCFENCCNMIADFESTYSVKYRSDLDEFIKESKYEDFYTDEKEVIYVSTIHKAKGREFDCVYMMLNNMMLLDDDAKRKLYVGITRAKESLYIHYNNDLFNDEQCIEDNKAYNQPNEIALQLSYRDIVLDFFKDKKEQVLKLYSGMELYLEGEYLLAKYNEKAFRVAKQSKACVEKLTQLKEKGYSLCSAEVGFVVAWKGKDEVEEIICKKRG